MNIEVSSESENSSEGLLHLPEIEIPKLSMRKDEPPKCLLEDICMNDTAFDQICGAMRSTESVLPVQSLAASASSSGYGSAVSDLVDCESGNSKKRAASDRSDKQKQIASEKAVKRAAIANSKIYKPAECMKYMTIELHPSLFAQWYMAELDREVSSAGVRVEATADIFREDIVMWSRRMERVLDLDDGEVQLSKSKEQCDHVLLIHTAEEIEPYVLEHKLSNHVADVKCILGCELTLVVFGVRDYFKTSTRKKRKSTNSKMTEIELQMALTDLLVTSNSGATIVNTSNELALLIYQFTKALAEKPHKLAKRLCEEQTAFHMKSDNKKCVTVDKQGNGLSRLWQQMIAILPHASLELSRAVCNSYKSPLALHEALLTPNGVNELADVGVERAAVPGAKSRRVGPEFARKMKIFLTADNGDEVLE